MNKQERVKKQSLLNEIQSLVRLSHGKGLTLGQLLQDLGGRGHALVSLVLCTPFILPMPLPGISTPFGIVLIVIGMALILDVQPWIPQRLKKVVIPHSALESIERKATPHLKRVEKWIRPRGVRWTSGRVGHAIHGVLILAAALFLALPAPPGGNMLPGVAITLASIALLEEDVVFTALSVVALLGTIAFFATIWVTIVKLFESISFG